jgi:hypothetical protein
MFSPTGGNDQAAELIRNFAQARQHHSDLLARFSACLRADPDVIVAPST